VFIGGLKEGVDTERLAKAFSAFGKATYHYHYHHHHHHHHHQEEAQS